MTEFVIAKIRGAQSNSICVNLTSFLYKTLANITQKMMPLYGFQSLTDVCVCILQRLSVRSYLCQFHLHLKTLFGPRTVQEINPIFSLES